MNVILSILQLILEVVRKLYKSKQEEKLQADSDAIDSDPASVFMSKFNKDSETSTSVPDSSKRNS
jgi:hypothetical protein